MTTKPDYFACEEQAVKRWSWQSNFLIFRLTKKYSIWYNGNRNSLRDHLTRECQAMPTWLRQKLGTRGQAKRVLFSLGFVRKCMGIEEDPKEAAVRWRSDLDPRGATNIAGSEQWGEGDKQGAEREAPAVVWPVGAGVRAGLGGMPDFCRRGHPAGALGFPAAPSAPGVISPICEVFLRPARKTSGYWILAQLHVQKIFCL